MGASLKQIAGMALFGRWGRRAAFEDGYAILLPSPMDMPFLLRYALEGLRLLDTADCKQVIVTPDGWGDDKGEGLRRVIAEFGDPRVELVEIGAKARFYISRLMKSVGAAANTSHWAQIVAGIEGSRCTHAFLHDADAFFLDADALETMYAACRDRGMDTLGVTGRWDTFFLQDDYHIPATWELMFSTRWARRHPPYYFKGQWRDTPRGRHEFDNLLYPEYLDYPSGKIGLIDPAPRIVHFNGAVTTYRFYRYQPKERVVDVLFRLLLLALLEEFAPAADGTRAVPTVEELVKGLDDPNARICYTTDAAAKEYPEFRRQVEELCEAPVFRGPRADRIRDLIAPFDRHFEKVAVAPDDPSLPLEARTRRVGLE